MSISQSYFTTANPYQSHRYNPVYATPQFLFEDAQDAAHFGAPPQKPSFLKTVLKGALLSGGLLLGGLAFKRYCPSLATQVGGFIPEVIQRPFKALSTTWLGRTLIQGAGGLLNQSEHLIKSLKGLFGSPFNKAG